MKDDTKIRIVSRFPNIASLKIGDCYLRVTLNTRLGRKRGRIKNPVCISFYIKGTNKTLYQVLPFKMFENEYVEMCKATGKGRKVLAENSPYFIKKQIIQAFDETAERLRVFAKHNQLTVDSVQLFLGTKSEGSVYFTDFWKNFNQTKSIGTRNAYELARKSFLKIVGAVGRTYITSEDIQNWERGLDAANISKTTVGMYERACKAAWNDAVRIGLASKEDNPFGKIPQGSNRKREWLDVTKMTELYDIFINHGYPEEWQDVHTRFVHQALGLFLFQYLANGINMADVAKLSFNDDYCQSGGQILTCIRQKTEDRTNTEVVIPLIDPLYKIIKELSGEPELGKPVFPMILKGKTDPNLISKEVAQANKNVRKGLRYLTEHLGWAVKPSGTWARHSFATNLAHAGVPDRYISEAMGHAVGSVTSRYIDMYPIARQIEYNSKLLKGEEKETVEISMEEYKRFLLFLENEKKGVNAKSG